MAADGKEDTSNLFHNARLRALSTERMAATNKSLA
jgi:hypothetical protein